MDDKKNLVFYLVCFLIEIVCVKVAPTPINYIGLGATGVLFILNFASFIEQWWGSR